MMRLFVLCGLVGGLLIGPAGGVRAQEVVVEEVESGSWVRDISFERVEGESAGTLRVRLGKDPEWIRYFEVPVAVWEELKAAESVGAFYGANIRQSYERQYGKSRAERFKSPIPVQSQVNALCAFNEECEEVILECIRKTDTSIFVAAYAFTRTRIAAELVAAHKRGVQVEVKMDVTQSEFAGAEKIVAYLRESGVPVTLIRTAGEYSAMHNKFMVFDLRWVVTGSYNFTTTAQVSNWENLVWVESADMAEQYKMAWDAIESDL